MIGLTQQGGTSYTYNGDGVLVGRGTTSYTQDLLAPLEQVLNDGTTNLVYGHTRMTSGTGTWYQHDGLGSVRAVLDGAGAVQSTTSYDPWDVPVPPVVPPGVGGGSPAPFGFTGELHDGDLVHLRARWYHPSIGTFTSRDPFAGFDTLPYSLHPYQYAYSNPVLLTDPSGEYVVLPTFCPIGYWYDEDKDICIRSDWMPEWFSETAEQGHILIIPGGGVAGVATGGQIGGQVAGQVAGQAGKKVLEELAKVCGALGLGALSAWLGNEIVEDLQTDVQPRTDDRDQQDEWTFVGYHGTSSVYVPAILTRINPPSTYGFVNQLGDGFYTTPDYTVAMEFAQVAVEVLESDGYEGGEPVVLKIYARNFKRMTRRVVPLNVDYVPDHYITNYDYLMSQIVNFAPTIQLKFNPRAYGDLRALP